MSKEERKELMKKLYRARHHGYTLGDDTGGDIDPVKDLKLPVDHGEGEDGL